MPGTTDLASVPLITALGNRGTPSVVIVVGNSTLRIPALALATLLATGIDVGISEAQAQALVDAGIAAHVAAADPHPQYLLTAAAEGMFVRMDGVFDADVGEFVFDLEGAIPGVPEQVFDT